MKHVAKIIFSLIVGFTGFFYVAMTPSLNAAPAGLYFNPGTSSVTQGQDFWVDIYGTTGANFGVPSTNVVVKYPGASLSVVDLNKNGSALPGATLTNNPSQQTVSFTYSFFGSSAGIDNKKLFSIKFRALTTGSAPVDFTSYFLGGNTVAKNPSTYTIVAPTCPAGQVGTPPNCTTPPPPTCPAGQVGTPPNCTTPAPVVPAPAPAPTPTTSTSNTPAPAPTPTAPAPNTSIPPVEENKDAQPEEAFSVKNTKLSVSYDSAAIDWQTNVSSTSMFTYGMSASKLDNKTTVTADKNNTSFSTKVAKLKLGARYFYAITSTSKDGKIATEKGSFTTKAYPVLLRVIYEDKPLQGGKVALQGYQESYTTNDKGEINLSLVPGDYKVKITKEAISQEQPFTVKALDLKPGRAPDTQIITMAISGTVPSSSGTSPLPLIILGTALLMLLIGGVVAVILWKKHRAQQDTFGYQSILEDMPQAPVETAQQSFDTQMNYQPPLEYTDPSLYQPPAQQYYPSPAPLTQEVGAYTAATPPPVNTLDIQEPSDDMWSSPSSAYIDPQPLTSSTITTPTYEEVAPSTEGLGTYTPEPLPPTNTPEPIVAYQEPQLESSPEPELPPSNPVEEYEYNEDNSMTIHHAS